MVPQRQKPLSRRQKQSGGIVDTKKFKNQKGQGCHILNVREVAFSNCGATACDDIDDPMVVAEAATSVLPSATTLGTPFFELDHEDDEPSRL